VNTQYRYEMTATKKEQFKVVRHLIVAGLRSRCQHSASSR